MAHDGHHAAAGARNERAGARYRRRREYGLAARRRSTSSADSTSIEQGNCTAAPGEARMLEIRRILCPIDFSDASRRALDHAVMIGGWYRSQIIGLHVANPAFVLEPPTANADSTAATSSI